jgi:hypothetical protein
MTDFQSYDYQEHLHRYGVWTAARAQRAFMTTAHIKNALDKIELKKKAFGLSTNTSENDFDKWHVEVCNGLKEVLTDKKRTPIAFGRAAKIVNIYLKTTIIIPNFQTGVPLVHAIHPPIDRILLKCLVACNYLPKNYLVNWTTMGQEVYTSIITALRLRFTNKPLWMIEACWKPENEKTPPR